jgi:hypothetical protein
LYALRFTGGKLDRFDGGATGLFGDLGLPSPSPLQKLFEERLRDGRLQLAPIGQSMVDLAKLLAALCRGEQLTAVFAMTSSPLPLRF